MEFPEDVLAIIRAYSKPLFKYYKEYKSVLKLNYLDEWTTLKKKINDELLPYLVAYQIAMDSWRHAMKMEHNYFEIGFTDFQMINIRYEKNRRKFNTNKKKKMLDNIFHRITLILYGERKEPYQLRDYSKLNAWK